MNASPEQMDAVTRQPGTILMMRRATWAKVSADLARSNPARLILWAENLHICETVAEDEIIAEPLAPLTWEQKRQQMGPKATVTVPKQHAVTLDMYHRFNGQRIRNEALSPLEPDVKGEM